MGGLSAVLAIQRAAGNQAVMRMLDAQRPGHPLAGPSTAVQRLSEDELDDDAVQRSAATLHEPSDDAIRSAAAEGVRTPSTTLPHLDRIQASFGRHSIAHIQAHLGPEAARASRAMNALAYASGDHVVFGSTPDLRTTAHEAAHIVQQQAGVQLAGGIGQEGDAYERHADAVADAVVAGRSAEGLLEPFASSNGEGPRDAPPSDPSAKPGRGRATANSAAIPPRMEATRAGGPALRGKLQRIFKRLDTPTEDGTDTYDVGIGNPVVIVDTVLKKSQSVFYYRVREISANPVYHGRTHYYLVDTDRLALDTRYFLLPQDVENYLRATNYPEKAVDAAVERMYADPVLEARFIEAVQSRDETQIQRLTAGLPQGLPNRCFDCFMNAILQLMAGPYADYFNPDKNRQTNSPNREVQETIWKIIQRINNVDASRITTEDVGDLRDTLLDHKVVLTENEQEDAAELMRKLLELVLPEEGGVRLRTERRVRGKDLVPPPEEQPENNPAVYHDVLGNEHISNMIEVSMEQYQDLHAFLREEFGTGTIIEYDADNYPRVHYNGAEKRASRVTERRAFASLPSVVTFYLKRFSVDVTGETRRIGRPFPMPRTLLLVEEGQVPSYVEYEMAGAVVHEGTLEAGHYYSHVKRGNRWARLDDDRIPRMDSLSTDQNQGYLYTYRRVAVHADLPEGSTALQETDPRPADFAPNPLNAFGRLLSQGSSSGALSADKTSERIRGVPNSGSDSALTAVLQLMAGPYAQWFNPKNQIKPAFKNLQYRIWSLILRINQHDNAQIKKQDVELLRDELDRQRISGLQSQANAGKLMEWLLHTFAPVGSRAKIQHPSGQHGNSVSRRTSEIVVIPVELGTFQSLEGFLYHHYGIAKTGVPKGSETSGGVVPEAPPQAPVRTSFRQLPPLLTIMLQRFSKEEGGRRILTRKFLMPEELVLVEEERPNEKGETRRRYVHYRLDAVLVHTGGDPESGHHIAYRKTPEEGAGGTPWLRADGDKVTESATIDAAVHEGSVYTYRQVLKGEELSRGNVAAQEKTGHGLDDLHKRLVYLIRNRRHNEALALLSVPGLDPNTRSRKGLSLLDEAIAVGAAAMVRGLLRHGADVSRLKVKEVPPEAADDVVRREIARMLQLYRMPQLTADPVFLGSTGAPPDQTLDRDRMLRLYGDLDALRQILEEQVATASNPDAMPEWEMTALAEGLETIRSYRKALNTHLASFYNIVRAGAGRRPDAAKALTLPEVSPNDKKTLESFVWKAKPERDRRSPEEILQSSGRQEREKIVQEALTALFAVKGGLFTNIEPSNYRFGEDIDFAARNGAAPNSPWDQKAIIVYEGSFSGRLSDTQNKLKLDKGNSFDPSKRPGKRPREHEKVGILFDSTYVDERNYELAWESILEAVLKGNLDPRYILETRAPDDLKMASDKFLDSGKSEKEPWVAGVLEAKRLSNNGASGSTLALDKIPGIDTLLVGIVNGTTPPFKTHEDFRGRLPPGFLYFEYPCTNLHLVNSCRLVVSHDRRHFYLTTTHYSAFSYLDASSQLVNGEPFFEILLSSDLERTLEEARKSRRDSKGGSIDEATGE